MITANGRDVGHARRVDVAGQLGLADADQHPGGEGDRERPEAGHERGRQRRQHEVRHVGDLQLHDRGDEDRRGTGQRRAERPVDGGDPVGREPDGRCGALVLGDRRRGDAELRVAVQRPQRHAERGGDADEDEAVERDRDVERVQHRHRQLRRDERDLRAVAEHGAGLQHDQHAERRDDAGQRRGAAQPPHDQQVGERADRRAGEEPGGPGDHDVVAVAP